MLANAVVDGQDRMEHNEYVVVNGVQQIERAIYTRSWSDMIWKRNGQNFSEMIFPIAKVVWEADVLQASSNGTIRVRLQWNQAPQFPAPSAVRVKVTSQAYIIASGDESAVRILDNGLNGPEEVLPPQPWPKVIKRAPEIRTVTVSQGGIAEFELNKEAYVGVSLPEGNIDGAAWADAHGGTMTPDSRNVTILVGGANVSQKKTTANTQSVAITSFSNPHHNVHPQNPDSYLNYVLTETEATPIEYASPALNSQTCKISLPVLFIPAGGSILDNPYLVFTLWFVGFADSWQTPTEHFAWSGGPTGDLPDAQGSWDFPSKSVQYRKHLLIASGDLYGNKWLIFDKTSSENLTISLDYTWSDGVMARAERNIVFMDPRYDVSISSEIEDHPIDRDVLLTFQGYGTRVPAIHASAEGIFKGGRFDKHALSLISGILAASFEALALGNPAFELPAAVAAAAGVFFEYVDNGEVSVPNIAQIGDPNFSWWHEGSSVWESGPVGWNPQQWDWEVPLRPIVTKQAVAYDKYGPNGYEGRFVEHKSKETDNLHSRRCRRFYKISGSGGGGTGGGSGGGQPG